LNCCPIFFFFEVLEKIKPSIGLKFYKKKHKKKKFTKVTATPLFLTLSAQYRKAIYWLSKSIKVRHEKKLILKIVNELYGINFLNVGESLKKKTEYYKFGVMFKVTKRFKW
jgi:ribosomal protein S7